MRPAPAPGALWEPRTPHHHLHPPFLLFLFLFVYRILFLRQQSKELDKLKNQNSYMV